VPPTGEVNQPLKVLPAKLVPGSTTEVVSWAVINATELPPSALKVSVSLTWVHCA